MRLASILARCSLVSARHRALEGDDRQLCAVGVADLIIQDTINGYALIGERHSLECIDAAAKATILLVGHIKRTSKRTWCLGGRWRGGGGRRDGLARHRRLALLDGNCREYDGF
jgi:hypothetical protein